MAFESTSTHSRGVQVNREAEKKKEEEREEERNAIERNYVVTNTHGWTKTQSVLLSEPVKQPFNVLYKTGPRSHPRVTV